MMDTERSKLISARSDVDRNPTEKQKEAGNYKKGHVNIHGFNITIENPKGSYRKGKDKNGKEWKTLMHNDYGYFTRTLGKDGDAIDVFIGPNLKSTKIFPVDQYIDGEFDETKIMLGFDSKQQAKEAYLSNYDKNWKGFKYISEIGIDEFKKWLYDGMRQRKAFALYKSLNESDMIKEDRNKSGKLNQILKQWGGMRRYGHKPFAGALSMLTDDCVVGAFSANELPNTQRGLIDFVKELGYDVQYGDEVERERLAKLDSDGFLMYLVYILPKEQTGEYYDKLSDRRKSAGRNEYRWKSSDAQDLMFNNPWYKDWPDESKEYIRDKVKKEYNVNESNIYNKSIKRNTYMKKPIKLSEKTLSKIINEAIRKSVYLDGDNAGEEFEYNTEDSYPEIMGRCKLAMRRISEQIGNLGHIASACFTAEMPEWEDRIRDASETLENVYRQIYVIYQQLEDNGIKPTLNRQPYKEPWER